MSMNEQAKDLLNAEDYLRGKSRPEIQPTKEESLFNFQGFRDDVIRQIKINQNNYNIAVAVKDDASVDKLIKSTASLLKSLREIERNIKELNGESDVI